MELLFREMEQYAAENHVPIINERGRKAFLQVVREQKPHRVLEVGMAIGYSTLQIAVNSADDVKITTMELSEERVKTARSYIARSGYDDRIRILTGDAGELLAHEAVQDAPFDFVFIDAAKGQYVDYFHKIEPLLSDSAVILADNVLFRGYVCSEEKPPRRFKTIVKRLREYLELVTKTPGYSTVILENGDGLAVTRREKSKC
ncbi:O-methyltransferase [Selenomonas ruminis]|uniref:tRNA 5-hydroxyuridine methyltransferase n=1 Tax=Selenomonas ruminis TaxID=2593411 RepID=A0A5D6W9G4_9FIRM|nr:MULTISPECIES: O-methyltransferase [unclassified Selenomonas]TYZ25151.1 O-methyltransferase [Selenomonas sp. mPRGC5]